MENFDPINHICSQIENGDEPSRWNVLGRVNQIIDRLKKRGTFQEKHEQMLWDLSDSANESL